MKYLVFSHLVIHWPVCLVSLFPQAARKLYQIQSSFTAALLSHTDFEARLSSETQPCHLGPVWTWVSHLSAMNLGLLNYKRGIIISPQAYEKDGGREYVWGAWLFSKHYLLSPFGFSFLWGLKCIILLLVPFWAGWFNPLSEKSMV